MVVSLKIRKLFLFLIPIIGAALLWQFQQALAAPVVIDDFDTGTLQEHVLFCCSDTANSTNSNAGSLGGERDMVATLLGGTSGVQVAAADPSLSTLDHYQSPSVTGQLTVTWDGPDGASTLNPTGLGGVDFTGAGSNSGLQVQIVSASGSGELLFTAYTDGTNYSTATLPLVGSIANQSFFIPFTDFTVAGGSGADFTDVGAFTMLIDGSAAPGFQVLIDLLTLTASDFGDLPPAYGMTTLATDGARHKIGDLYLGSTIDSEADGIPSANANSDDDIGAVDDEDGVVPTGNWAIGVDGGAVEVTSTGIGCVSGWVDWDNNSNFSNVGDDVIVMSEVMTGTNTISFTIPANADLGQTTFSRFRLVPDTGAIPDCSDDTPVALTGEVINGEVEDHLLPALTGLSISDVTVDEAVGNATFTVTLAALVAADVQVDYTTSDGTAIAPDDYTTVSNTLTIPANTISATITVPIIDDNLDEPSETFSVDLSNAVNAALTNSQGVGIIIDNDSSPVAANDFYTTTEDITLNIVAPGVLDNDTDADTDPLTAVLNTGPANGSVALNLDGSFIYTPTANFNGGDSFTYRANDGNNNSTITTVFINITPVNDPLTAVDDTPTTPEDTLININVLANDIDVDGDADVVAITVPANGSATLNPDNTVAYTPTLNFNGTDIFNYSISDGVFTDTAVVTVTVLSVNDLPVVSLSVVTTPTLEGTPIQFNGTVVDPGRSSSMGGGGTTLWDFGDGTTITGTLTPSHTYGDNGLYNVTLTFTDTQGASASESVVVDVENVTPLVSAGPDQTVAFGSATSFTGSFTDPGTLDTHFIEWDLGDGTSVFNTLTPNHTYANPGTYTVTLTVMDDDDGIGTDQLVINVFQNNIYLPIVFNNTVQAPDLEIQDVTVTADNVTIVIENSGNQTVTDGFWVDLYINPDPVPTAANQTWEQLSDEGLVWGITDVSALVPGGTLVLDLNHASLDMALSNFSGQFSDGMAVYVQVDSANIARNSGGVEELHEILNGPYNNIAQVTVSLIP